MDAILITIYAIAPFPKVDYLGMGGEEIPLQRCGPGLCAANM